MSNFHGPLDEMPPELALEVAKYLDRTSLLSLALVSRAMAASSQDLLVQHAWFDNSSDGMAILYFIRTLLERPDLANKVVSLSIETNIQRVRGLGSEEPSESLNPELDFGALCHQIRHAEDAHGNQQYDLFINDLDSGHHSAFVAVLLGHLPNLRKLDLMVGPLDSTHQIFSACYTADLSFKLQHLRELTVAITSANTLALFPNLQTLNLTQVNSFALSRFQGKSLEVSMPRLENLSIRGTFSSNLVGLDGLSRALNCPSLKRLRVYQRHMPGVREPAEITMYYSTCVDTCLLPSSWSAIEKLDIDVSLLEHDRSKIFHIPFSNSLQLPNLRHVAIPLPALFGSHPSDFLQLEELEEGNAHAIWHAEGLVRRIWDSRAHGIPRKIFGDDLKVSSNYLAWTFANGLNLLPPALEILELYLCDDRTISFLEYIINDYVGPIKLRKIVWRDPWDEIDLPSPDTIANLQRKFENIGVELDYWCYFR